jgi:hypothetical protein
LQEELEENQEAQNEFFIMGQAIVEDPGYDVQAVGRVTRQMDEVRDHSERLLSTLSELDSTLSTLHNSMASFERELEITSCAVSALDDRVSQLMPPVGMRPGWIAEQSEVLEVSINVLHLLFI